METGDGVLTEAYDPVCFPGDDLFAILRPRGLPIGNLTSQFWANVYLNAFDRFVKRELRCAGYVRYVDDLLFFADDKPRLWTWLQGVEERLATLRLVLHKGAHPRPVAEGFPFLGFVLSPTRRRLAQIVNQANSGRASRDAVKDAVRGWVNHVRFGNTVGLRKAVLRTVVLR